MNKASTIDEPFYFYNPKNDTYHKKYKNNPHIQKKTNFIYSMEGDGIQIMSIDKLPTELPIDSSQHFSSSLFPYIIELVYSLYILITYKKIKRQKGISIIKY